MKATHTKGEWAMDHALDAHGNITIRREDGTPHGDTETCIATVYSLADARLIVRAVNAHEDLLAACEAAYEELFDYAVKRGSGENGSTIQRLAQAINKARGHGKGQP